MKMHYSVLLILAGAWPIAADPALPHVSTWFKSVKTPNTQEEMDARFLWEDGQARLRAGKYGTATLAFQTLIAVYPESPLVPRAAEAMRTSAKLEKAQANERMVRSLRFENLQGVKIQEILQRLEEREIELGVEKPSTTRMLEEAKAALTELLSERGLANPRVQVSTREVPPGSVEITFRVVADQAGRP